MNLLRETAALALEGIAAELVATRVDIAEDERRDRVRAFHQLQQNLQRWGDGFVEDMRDAEQEWRQP